MTPASVPVAAGLPQRRYLAGRPLEWARDWAVIAYATAAAMATAAVGASGATVIAVDFALYVLASGSLLAVPLVSGAVAMPPLLEYLRTRTSVKLTFTLAPLVATWIAWLVSAGLLAVGVFFAQLTWTLPAPFIVEGLMITTYGAAIGAGVSGAFYAATLLPYTVVQVTGSHRWPVMMAAPALLGTLTWALL